MQTAVHLTGTPAACAADSPEPAQRLQACLALAGRGSTALPGEALAAASEAATLARQLDRPLDCGRALELCSLHLGRLGRYPEAVAAADEALPWLQVPELLAERCTALRTKALAASEANVFDAAIAAANELVQLTRSGDATIALDAAFALAACFERMGDAWQAERVMTSALADHGPRASAASQLAAYNCLSVIGIGMMHRLLDSRQEGAELQALLQRTRAAAERSRALAAQLPDPAYHAPVMGNLAELMLHQGELAESTVLLHQALASAQLRGQRSYVWRLRITLADWHLANQDPAAALALACGVLDEMGDHPHPPATIRGHRSAYRACRLLGRFEEALQHLEVAQCHELRDVGLKMQAQSALFVSRAEAQHVQWQAEQAMQEAQQQRERAAEAAATAERDALTGLGNRRHLERRCRELLPELQRGGRPLVLAQIDIDRFKLINDSCGHATGDRVLVVMAQLLHENMRATDVLARQGGEEFIVVLPDTDLDAATDALERLRERVASHPWAQLGGPAWAVTVSIGVANAPPYDLPTLLEHADAAMYRAKRSGRNRLCR